MPLTDAELDALPPAAAQEIRDARDYLQWMEAYFAWMAQLTPAERCMVNGCGGLA